MLNEVLKRFEREAKALAKLSHPNIVHVHDYGNYEGAPYLVMEYLPSGALKERADDPLSVQQGLRILLPIAQALAYATSIISFIEISNPPISADRKRPADALRFWHRQADRNQAAHSPAPA